jgi:hypothetical protein
MSLAEKESGRWGDRPLGAWGMEGTCGLKSARIFVTPDNARGRTFRCAREQQNDAQEQKAENHFSLRKHEPTPDHIWEFAV